MKKFISGFLSCFLLCSVTYVIAASIGSNEVLYDNSSSHSNVDNVQDALDDLYNIYDHSSLGFSLLTHNPSGLSTELLGGLYRYQGVQDSYTNVNNYICFGTTNKNTCVGDVNKYMYRIIGINEAGQLKLIKKDPMSYAWSSNSSSVWSNSSLYIGLNGSYFLTNTTYIPDSTWSDKIAVVNWKYGDITEASKTASAIYNDEMAFSYSVDAKIGIMYLHDYYYGLPGNINCYSNGSLCRTSWLRITNENYDYNEEFLIDRHSQAYVWYTAASGSVWKGNTSSISSNKSVRPVFYLNADEHIASGNGTLTDPYILS